MSNYYEAKVFDYSQLTTSDLPSLPCAYMPACMNPLARNGLISVT